MAVLERLANLEWFEVADGFGCDQNWYANPWQRAAGCGPTTGANIFYYCARKDPALGALYTYTPPAAQENLLRLMDDVWGCITPGPMGVHTTQMFAAGAGRYAASRGVTLGWEIFDVGAGRGPEHFRGFVAFICGGLAAGRPLGFLNLSGGKLENLQDWHWVNLLSLEEEAGEFFCLAADEGVAKRLNVSLWYDTSRLGGGVVRAI
jgi:hypothetical protein